MDRDTDDFPTLIERTTANGAPASAFPPRTTGPFGEPIAIYNLQTAIEALPKSQQGDHTSLGGWTFLTSGDPVFLRILNKRGHFVSSFDRRGGREALAFVTEHSKEILGAFDKMSRQRVAQGIPANRFGIDYGHRWP